MKKTKIQEILNLSSLTMVDPEYTIFTRYIKSGLLTDARLFIENFIEENTNSEDGVDNEFDYVDFAKRCHRLENLVLDLIISEEDVKHEYKPRRKRVRRSPVQ